ncbi:phosphatase [Pelosinus sp. IPA-1]|uniref:phosphatase n=1 Tax=Pelosinus sp. IPA-1 TaxID=3029569 RepID=UPI002556FF28|nr:phosphatase [Pelosinus sp. IPA-1]
MHIELDVHTHTVVSGHAYSTIREMAREASKKGLKLLGITEHAPGIPGTCSCIYFENLRVIPRNMYRVELLLGAEINILDYDGKLSLEDRLIDKLDIRIAGIHNHCYIPGTIEQNTSAIIGAIKNPKIDIISHPDDGSCPLDYDVIVQAAKKYNTLLEVNNNSLNPINGRKSARENNIRMLFLCKKYDVPIILASDAHVDIDISRFDFVDEILHDVNFPEELIINKSAIDFKNRLRLNRSNNFI